MAGLIAWAGVFRDGVACTGCLMTLAPTFSLPSAACPAVRALLVCTNHSVAFVCARSSCCVANCADKFSDVGAFRAAFAQPVTGPFLPQAQLIPCTVWHCQAARPATARQLALGGEALSGVNVHGATSRYCNLLALGGAPRELLPSACSRLSVLQTALALEGVKARRSPGTPRSLTSWTVSGLAATTDGAVLGTKYAVSSSVHSQETTGRAGQWLRCCTGRRSRHVVCKLAQIGEGIPQDTMI